MPKNSKMSVVSIEGNVDIYTSPHMKGEISKLIKKRIPIILIDLNEVKYMDSSGIATFVESFKNIKKYEGKFILYNLPAIVIDVFKMTKLEKIFEIYENETTAFENI